MGEKLNKVIMPLAATAAAATLGAGKAEAAPEYPVSGASPEIAQAAEPYQSMEAINHWANEHFRSGEDLNFFRGNVTVSDQKGDKVTIINPIVMYRYGATSPKQEKFALNHPRSKYWAIGYIKPAVAGDQKGGPAQVVMLPFNNGGNNFQFHKENSSITPVGDHPAVDVVRFTQDKYGQPNLNQPTDHFGHPLLEEQTNQSMAIGKAITPFPKTDGHKVK